MATVTDSNDNNPAPENPNKTLDPTLPDPVIVATEPVDDTNATEAAEVKTSPPAESGNDVPLSEKEKCNSRAERLISNLFHSSVFQIYIQSSVLLSSFVCRSSCIDLYTYFCVSNFRFI